MKKSVLFRIALVMLVLTMVTSCFVGGTFAKYVTSETGADSARVAKFGVEITANGETFAAAYDSVGNGNDSVITAGAITVDAADDKDVVAPGTKGNMASMVLSGTPEVDVEVSYKAEVDLAGWNVNGSVYYCPLIIKVNDTEIKTSDTVTSEADFEQAIKNAIEGYSKIYNANTDLSTVKADSLAISWEWPFSTSAENDVKDTYLGDQAADNQAATISLTVTTTVTQID